MLFVCALVVPCLRTYTYKQEKSEHNYLRCRDSLCHSTHTSAIETWVRNRVLVRTLVFIFVLKSLFWTILGTFRVPFFFWPGKTIPHYIKNLRFSVKQTKISKFGTAKPKNSFLFNFAIVHIPCVFCVCPNSSTATAALLAGHKPSIVNTVRKVRHSFTSHVIVDKIMLNKNVNYDKTNEM